MKKGGIPLKLKHLQGIWKDAAVSYHQSTASEMVGWYYSRYCVGEAIDQETILKEIRQVYPKVENLELDPFIVTVRVGTTELLKIKYRSTGIRIGYTYKTEQLRGGENHAITETSAWQRSREKK